MHFIRPLVFLLTSALLYAGSAASFSAVTVKKTIISFDDTLHMEFIHDPAFFSEGWDTLAQTRFWHQVINLTSDTCILNIAECRKAIDRIDRVTWSAQSEEQKVCFKDSVCSVHDLELGTNLYVTAGKEEFYQIKKTLSIIDQSIEVFEKNGCDPWYAQTILLIESPGKLNSRSSVGARGPFQLMPSVARRYGLVVNRSVDQRTDVRKAAKAASSLVKNSCIPSVKAMLDSRGIPYSENDLWFRLMVLHVYHAGAGNVRCLFDFIRPGTSGVEFMLQVWKTTCASFKNEAQNYSQAALGSVLNFEELISKDGDTVYLVTGDKLLHEYRAFRKDMVPVEAFEYLTQNLHAYEDDFLDEMMDYDQFIGRVADVRGEFVALAKMVSFNDGDVRFKAYPSDADHLAQLADKLMKRRRYDDAKRLLRMGADIHPESAQLIDSLVRIFRITGDQQMSDFYLKKSQEMSKDK